MCQMEVRWFMVVEHRNPKFTTPCGRAGEMLKVACMANKYEPVRGSKF